MSNVSKSDCNHMDFEINNLSKSQCSCRVFQISNVSIFDCNHIWTLDISNLSKSDYNYTDLKISNVSRSDYNYMDLEISNVSRLGCPKRSKRGQKWRSEDR